MLPLFFSWYPIFVIYYEDDTLRRNCIRSFFLTVSFFVLLILAAFLTFIPKYGSIIANLTHLFGILLYISVSCILIYSIIKNKTVEFKILENLVNKFDIFLKS
jgi:uncharacterized membrane protein